MSELNAAMQAAVASVDTDRRQRGDAHNRRHQPAPSSSRPALVLVRDDADLPPIVSRRGPTTFTDVLREQYGSLVATLWHTMREAVLMVVLFWVSAIMLAFVEVEGAVSIPGVGDATVITVALVVATALRVVLAAASWSGEALQSRSR